MSSERRQDDDSMLNQFIYDTSSLQDRLIQSSGADHAMTPSPPIASDSKPVGSGVYGKKKGKKSEGNKN
ncbi:hypothetical protein FALBO_16462 [Fusarium albosuccineum]|uniref:Uncharacterized protein n=1 Tax=Fusarium albosuccineum TaxID=1237068 RepID=A0A8H4KIV2_9HYPO|nr:hypothetical protein FALBO_16462 [Fusarium albosuccineum]